MEVDTGEVSASGTNGKDGKQEEQNTVASDEQIEEVFDILPIVSELLENITTSNVAEKVDDTPKRIDVTQKIAALKAKFNAAEEFLQNISGGYLSETVQQEEFKTLQEILKKKSEFYEKCRSSKAGEAGAGASATET